ncbi:hypothetical protein H5410_056475 [Solanum commersonii]|uniref:Uncharacterized protein n=1 Tax=Solanum commersonii TaxID=4109 RepID=A0A9J5WLU0_SOLCO|nr:hypothetical protein H5410_056475 [Solanum commersonii]
MMSEIWITKRSIDYSTRKLAKWGAYLFWGSFDLENGPICPSRETGCNAKWPIFSFQPTDSIAKVLTESKKNFSKKDIGNPDHQKIHRL